MSDAEEIFRAAAYAEAVQPAVDALVGRTIVKAHIEENVVHLTLDDGALIEFVAWSSYADEDGLSIHVNNEMIDTDRAYFIGPRVPVDPNSLSGILSSLYLKPLTAQLNHAASLIGMLEDEKPR